MKIQQYQLTVYLPDNANRPAVTAPRLEHPERSEGDDAHSTKALSIREAALAYLGDKPEPEKPVARLIH